MQDRIKRMRETMGISREQFARLVGTTSSTVFRWERGTGKPSPMARIMLRRVFDEYLAKKRDLEAKYDPLA